MHQEYHRWYTHRLGREMGVRVHGHYGPPAIVFPTSGGDEWEYDNQGMVAHLARHIDAGRVKLFCVNSVNNESWYNRGAHPRHRSYLQSMYDDYLSAEVFPFVESHCQTPGIGLTTVGASFGAYHAVNTLLKHPNRVKRALGQSGVYDVRRFMDGDYDDNCYFNNPVDYVANLSDQWYLNHLASCDIRLITGCGPWESSGPSYHLAELLRGRGIPVALDDWGPDGGHDWPFWKRQLDVYLGS
jgi:esterase/lipase superfamily enzyme